MKPERVWRCARCTAMNRDRDLKCGDCGKTRDVLDAFVARSWLEIERVRAEVETLAQLYASASFHSGYDLL